MSLHLAKEYKIPVCEKTVTTIRRGREFVKDVDESPDTEGTKRERT